MRNPVLVAAVAAGKASALATRVFGRGGGTALPGLVAQALYPSVLRDLTAQLPEGCVVVTGTNGKTTSSRMLGSILDAAGLHPLHNRSGSNLERGLVSTVIGAATPGAGLPGGIRVGLFEVDEAAISTVLPSLRPRVTVFNNLFRDQLDRYGEIDAVYSRWLAALPRLAPRSALVLNADDPAIAYLAFAKGLRAAPHSFGISDRSHALGALPHAADSISCPRCNSRLQYSLILLSHLGHWRCDNCGLERPEPEVAASRVLLHGTDKSELTLTTPLGELDITLQVPGLYNVYNALSAATAALAMGTSLAHIKVGLEAFSSAFGRIERVAIPGADNKSLLMALVKNPVGFNEVLRMLFSEEQAITVDNGLQPSPARPRHLLIIINDLTADGRDVSWLWDVDFELLADAPGGVASVFVSGIRAADMALRLKYAGVDPTRITSGEDIAETLDKALRNLPNGETLYICPTYTAMLAFRKLLHERGWVNKQFWDD